MDNGLLILVVSCRPGNRKVLMQVFEGLPINAYFAPSIQQAKQALGLRPFSVVFCEERLPDGWYVDLLRHIQSASDAIRFVVLLCTGESEEYLEALRLGAEEVLHRPLQPTDVDLALIHAMRDAPHTRARTYHARCLRPWPVRRNSQFERDSPPAIAAFFFTATGSSATISAPRFDVDETRRMPPQIRKRSRMLVKPIPFLHLFEADRKKIRATGRKAASSLAGLGSARWFESLGDQSRLLHARTHQHDPSHPRDLLRVTNLVQVLSK